MYANNTHYWMDGEPVNWGGLLLFPGDPNDNEDASRLLYGCGWWAVADFTPKDFEFRVLCEI